MHLHAFYILPRRIRGMPGVERIRLYPVKGFGGTDVEDARILESGTLELDREFALYDGDDIVNGKITDAVHGYTTDADASADELTVSSPDGDSVVVPVSDDGRHELQDWFADRDGALADATVLRDGSFGFVDRRDRLPSVSVVSTATVCEVASWFDGIDTDDVRRRLRTNVEVSGVPPFWEDGFVGEGAPSFTVGGTRFEGAEPCARCVVPTRDPETGETTEGFRETFVRRRRETIDDSDAFDHAYTVTLIARVDEEDRGSVLRVGDPVEVTDG